MQPGTWTLPRLQQSPETNIYDRRKFNARQILIKRAYATRKRQFFGTPKLCRSTENKLAKSVDFHNTKHRPSVHAYRRHLHFLLLLFAHRLFTWGTGELPGRQETRIAIEMHKQRWVRFGRSDDVWIPIEYVIKWVVVFPQYFFFRPLE